MDVIEAIRSRRSIGKMRPEAPTRAQIEKLLEMATYAPNHHETEPWRFLVLAGQARQELGELMMNNLRERMSETESEKARAALDKERAKPLRAPVLLVVVSKHTPSQKVVDIEDIEATAAACQNILLTAQDMGLATIWRTGDPAYNAKVKAWLGLEAVDHIVGIIYVGYAAVPVSERDERSFEDKTRWLGWAEQ